MTTEQPLRTKHRQQISGTLVLVVMLASLASVAAYATIPGLVGPLIQSGPIGGGGGPRAPGIPLQINHQGVVKVGDVRLDGTGYFRFALIDSGGLNLWTNDGTQLGTSTMPDTTVDLTVAKGIYSVRLGSGPMPSIPSSVFSDDTVKLRIWFDDGTSGVELLSPDHDLTSSPYAHHAASADELGGMTAAQILSAASPVGTVVAFAGPTPPAGWLLCDGAAVNRTTYADLYAVIGDTWGYGDQSATFNLPDLRGRFLRGVNDPPASGEPDPARDPDVGSRSECKPGGATGDSVGSVQEDAFQGHRHDSHVTRYSSDNSHNWTYTYQYGDTTSGDTVQMVEDPVTDSVNGPPRTSSETRSKNAYVNYIIKH